MKKVMFLLWLAAAPLCFCSCKCFTDGISNQTANPVRVKATFGNGVVIDDLQIWGTNYSKPGIVFRWPVRIESLEAFDASGKKIGDFSRSEVHHHWITCWKGIDYAIFDDGIFPVVESCWQTGSPVLSEDQVKSAFKRETGQ